MGPYDAAASCSRRRRDGTHLLRPGLERLGALHHVLPLELRAELRLHVVERGDGIGVLPCGRMA
jgi:hypothetical protein